MKLSRKILKRFLLIIFVFLIFNQEMYSECAVCYTIVYVELKEKFGKKKNFFFAVPPEIEDTNGKTSPIRLDQIHLDQIEIERKWKKTGFLTFYKKIQKSVDENGDNAYCSLQKPVIRKAFSISKITIIRHIQNVYSPITFCKSK
ncbi:hypothetical protein LEP1GSC034_1590 [Leptospira interrogans str. 2003000735]|uniref:Uncharacterized protein n=5 Tax=Leptospira interrogans TaxID=173 RepID=Q8F8U4_LEPIN|nr:MULTISPECIES: hypothetical protein [Leptospira]EMM93366.1 hypothetical protein LEP1GSC158_4128 [Leptospira interrogans serovar Zanoni str. LT2156]EMY04784.1 hypothetical protein LEP1GSC029_2046 [Leptospira interrogans str. 2002000626]EMY23241.1 hypothetical protein LEP1GSC115_5072 [Leptospira interrogans serovar Australis str. 200703203]AAN47657.1 hypothetical protein LA_0458 [Leptospira interrogans serovar Lai str. 56601]AER01202.1 hypothetical protein LIF_A0391 [Leptospira interrogans ser